VLGPSTKVLPIPPPRPAKRQSLTSAQAPVADQQPKRVRVLTITIKWELTRLRSEIVLSNMKNSSFLLFFFISLFYFRLYLHYCSYSICSLLYDLFHSVNPFASPYHPCHLTVPPKRLTNFGCLRRSSSVHNVPTGQQKYKFGSVILPHAGIRPAGSRAD
jgi:hypothetical protein